MGDKSNICLSCGHYAEEGSRFTATYHIHCYRAIINEENRLTSILAVAREIVEGYKALGGTYYSHSLGCECGGTPDGVNYCGKLTRAFHKLTELVENYDKI